MLVTTLEAFLNSLPNFVYELVWMFVGFLFALMYTAWRLFRYHRAFFSGQLRDEVIVIGSIVEETEPGVWYLKPRTLQSAQSLLAAFPNPVLARAIYRATKRCHTETPEGSFITLRDASVHHIFMKRVVDLASELGAVGHLARMGGVSVSVEEFYVCATYAADGAHKKIRIDLIAADVLRNFLDSEFVAALTYRADEGSHADVATIFAVCAKEVFEHQATERTRVHRVSIPIVL